MRFELDFDDYHGKIFPVLDNYFRAKKYEKRKY